MFSLSGKTALITGATGGIGSAIARTFHAAGASVALSGRQVDKLESLATELGERAYVVPCDLANKEQVAKLIDAATAKLGRVDILVNNAGIRISKPFGEFTNKDFDQVIWVNLKAAFMASQAVIPAMKANGGGRIINIASQMGLVTDQDVSLYGLTKAALIHLTKSMAFELAPYNILVNAVSPGPTMTEFNVDRTTKNPALKTRRLSYLRTGHYVNPEEIAEVVAFLATTNAASMLGHNLIVDGGYVTH